MNVVQNGVLVGSGSWAAEGNRAADHAVGVAVDDVERAIFDIDDIKAIGLFAYRNAKWRGSLCDARSGHVASIGKIRLSGLYPVDDLIRHAVHHHQLGREIIGHIESIGLWVDGGVCGEVN